MAKRSQYALPFSALVGQERLKLGLILNAINPAIGGLLIRGPKGTGKTTAVYAMANLLPEREVIADCPRRDGISLFDLPRKTSRERRRDIIS